MTGSSRDCRRHSLAGRLRNAGPAPADAPAAWRLLGALVLVATSAPATLRTQGVRISGTTWVQSIDLRPLEEDSLLAAQVTGVGTARRTCEGQLVQCPATSS